MKRLVCYCSGGLANRVRPLAAYRALAERLGRQFSFIWHPDVTCGARFDAFFRDDSLRELEDGEACALPPGTFFSRRDSFENAGLREPDFFPRFASGHEVREVSLKAISRSSADTVIVLDNAPCRIRPDLYLKSLARIGFKYAERTGSPSVHVGIHVRLTDFREAAGVSEEIYRGMIERAARELDRIDPSWRQEAVFVASDEAAGVALVRQVIGGSVLTQDDTVYVSRLDASGEGWHFNENRTAESMVSAGKDLATLIDAKVRVGFLGSSFFALAREMAATRHRRYGGPHWSVYSIKKAADRNLARLGLGPDVFLAMPQGKEDVPGE